MSIEQQQGTDDAVYLGPSEAGPDGIVRPPAIQQPPFVPQTARVPTEADTLTTD